MRYDYNGKLLASARSLRKNMTPQESHLWYDFLRFCKPRFRRQEMIGNYIADFYCHDAKLIIELDGSQHYDPLEREKDNQRTAYFHTLGLRVLRFSNLDINRKFDSVCQAIIIAADACNVKISLNYDDK